MSTPIQILSEWVKCLIRSLTLMLLEKVSLCRSCHHEYSDCTRGPRLCSRKISQTCRNPLPSMYIGFLSPQNNGLTKNSVCWTGAGWEKQGCTCFQLCSTYVVYACFYLCLQASCRRPPEYSWKHSYSLGNVSILTTLLHILFTFHVALEP